MNKKIIAITLVLDALLIAVFCNRIETFGVTNLDLSWTVSALLPKSIIVLSSIIGTYLLFSINKKLWIWIIPPLCFGIGFYSSPIYQGDYNKEGTSITKDIDSNAIISQLKKEKPHFDGLITVVSATCPHCVAAAQRLTILKKRNPDLDISFLMYARDTVKVNKFKSFTKTDDYEYILNDNMKDVFTINRGSFPYFIYLKNGEILHRWHNQELGYRALDWIENKLK